eukprot:520986-Prymnesium_polylepis.1
MSKTEHTLVTPLIRACVLPPPFRRVRKPRIWGEKEAAHARGNGAGAGAGAGGGAGAGPPLDLRPELVVRDALLGEAEGFCEANHGAHSPRGAHTEACTPRAVLPGGDVGPAAGRCGW